MMKILLIATGGTIAMQTSASGDKRHELTGKELREYVEDDHVSVTVEEYATHPSSMFNSDFARDLVSFIQTRQHLFHGIIITHGTDTLEETAFYLEVAFQPKLPVMLTGSMRTAEEPEYDGSFNIRHAFRAVVSGKFQNRVFVAFAGNVFSALWAEKTYSLAIEAFSSGNYGKTGETYPEVRVFQYPVDHIRLNNTPAGKVALLKVHYDLETDIIASVLNKSDGIIIETLGSGRIPERFMDLMHYYAEKRIIAITSRCYSNALYDNYSYAGSYKDLKRLPVIFSPFNSLKSCILMKLCMGNFNDFYKMKNTIEGFLSSNK